MLPIIEYNYFFRKLSFQPKEAALKNFAVFTGKHLCLLTRGSFIKKRHKHRCFPVNISKYFRATILKNSCERLLLRLTLESHPRVPPQGLTIGSLHRAPPQGPTLGSWVPFFRYAIKLFRQRCFPVSVAKFSRITVLQNICKRLFSSNEEQHLLAKLDNMG